MKILIIQTAFIGDVVLATALIEKIHRFHPQASIDFLLRKGNENLLGNHPKINQVLVWDKKQSKYKHLYQLIKIIRKESYDKVVNLHRFSSSGILSKFSGAKEVIGFDKNPWSWGFDRKVKHVIGSKGDKHYQHEVERCLSLVAPFTDSGFEKPRLYPSKDDFEKVKQYQRTSYLTMAPSSVWKTKALPEEKWVKLIQSRKDKTIYLLGAPSDIPYLEAIKEKSNHDGIVVLAGELSLLQSAALMKSASMNYVNDSAPMHLCSSMDAPVTVFYCSTIPEFGFGPLSSNSTVIEVQENLSCRPCGLHGYNECPKGHFNCAYKIEIPHSR